MHLTSVKKKKKKNTDDILLFALRRKHKCAQAKCFYPRVIQKA